MNFKENCQPQISTLILKIKQNHKLEIANKRSVCTFMISRQSELLGFTQQKLLLNY